MARVEINEVTAGRDGRPLRGASVQVNVHGGGAATVYAGESGSGTLPNPFKSDELGQINAWVDPGTYDLVITAGKKTTTHIYEAVSATAAPVGGGGGGTVPPGWYNVKDAAYGAVGDGAVDDTVAIQNAINAAKTAGGGTVYFPQGTYKVTATLNCNDSQGLRLLGVGGRKQWSLNPTIQFTASGSADVISAARTTGFTMDSLRVSYTSLTYTGHVVNLSWGTGAGDPQQWGFFNCAFRGDGSANSAASLIRLNRAIIGTIEKCHFGRAVVAINHDANYAVGVVVRDCTFNATQNAPIQTTGGAENWTVESNVFEPATNGQQGKAWRHQNGLMWGMNYNFNWHGDVGAGGGSWIEIAAAGLWRSGTAIGNNFNGAAQAPALSMTGGNSQIESVLFGYNYCPNGVLDFSGGGSPAFTGLLQGNWGLASILGTTKIAAGWADLQSNGPTLMANAAGAKIGIGLSGDKQPQWSLDVMKPGADGRALRVKGGMAFSNSNAHEGTTDYTIGLGTSTWGLEISDGVSGGAPSGGNLGLVLNETGGIGNPAANQVVLYAKDNGSGKTQLRCRFADGTDTLLATQP